MMQGSKTEKIVSVVLAALMIFSVFAWQTNAVSFGAEVQNETAVFKNAESGGNVIALTESRTFTAEILLNGDSFVSQTDIDSGKIVWSLNRDSEKMYVDSELFPHQTAGGPLSTWKTAEGADFFYDIETSLKTEGENTYLCVTFKNNCYFGSDPSTTHSEGGDYLDICGYFNLEAEKNGRKIGAAAVKIVPYDSFHTMAEIYDEIDKMEEFANQETDLYVKKFSMGQSSGVLYEPLDMPYLIIAGAEKDVAQWLAFTEEAEINPDKVLSDLENGVCDDIKVPVMYSNIHANEVSAPDGILKFAWMLLESASSGKEIEYKELTGFTADGKAQLAAEHGPAGKAGSLAVPDLVAEKATYLGAITDKNDGISGPVDLDKYYTSVTEKVSAETLLEDVFFIIVPEENVEGRTYITREASNGYDLNRDNSFQTTPETQNMQKLIGTFNPVMMTEFHGRVEGYQVEPCDPPHEPNFEYDLLAEHLVAGGEAFGTAAVANNDSYNSYVMPQRDYLYYTGNKTESGSDETYWESPWDDMSTSYTPQFAMLHGTVAYTVELPAYNDDTAQSVQYGCMGQASYIAEEKLEILANQVEIFRRGVTNFNSNAYELVGQWFCDQYDIEGAEADLFRPEFNGEGENGNFYPEFYIIPLDGAHQSNLKAAYDMMKYLARNDVKILLTEDEFTYGKTEYPAGTMIVSMHQAKRSVANGVLYDGTMISSWTVLYSEGITSFAQTRGFDMITVASPSAYNEVISICGDFMNEEECDAYLAGKGSYFSGASGADVILSNASLDSAAAVNALLKTGKKVGMITDKDSKYYGDFICSYQDYLTVSDDYILSATGIAPQNLNYPEAHVITEAPVIYIAGEQPESENGFRYSLRLDWDHYGWNYDRVAMELMNFNTTSDANAADVIIGTSCLEEEAVSAVKNGTPYIGYGAGAASTAGEFFGSEEFQRASAEGMDCLGYVIYPNTTLLNASYVLDGDNIMYGFEDSYIYDEATGKYLSAGIGYLTEIPEGASVLVAMDGSKAPTEGFIKAITEEQKLLKDTYLNGSVQGFSYEGKDKDGDEITIALFANSLTHKAHQQDEYAYISNFIFSNMLGGAYVPAASWDYEANEKIHCVSSTYKDTKNNTWYHEGIDYVLYMGIMDGYNGYEFGTNDSLTREQLVTVLYRMAGQPKEIAMDENEADTSSGTFSDVKDGKYYTDAVSWAQASGIVNGYSTSVFGVSDSITREQFVTILYRYAEYMNYDISTGGMAVSEFEDKEKLAGWAEEAMTWAIGEEIIHGTSDTKLSPDAALTRAQLACAVQRFHSAGAEEN